MRKRFPKQVQNRRAGLAPLELVLYLPIMLFVMALMVNFGNIAAWKVRAQGNTRYAATRTLDDRTGHNEANPNTWPTPATLGTSRDNPLDDVAQIWDQHPDLTTPVVRGPVIVEGDQGNSIEVTGRMLMDARVHEGTSSVRRRLPLLRGILAHDGRYGFDQQQQILDQRWEYRIDPDGGSMGGYRTSGITGDSGNRARRAKSWYRIDPLWFPRIRSEWSNLGSAHARLVENPTALDLDPLDRDVDFFSIRLAQQTSGIASAIQPPIPDNTRVSVPDFHPRARRLCVLDLMDTQQRSVDPLINSIQRLPGSMAGSFINLYRGEIARLEAMEPPPQAEIDRIQQLLDQVTRFQQSLPRQYR